MIDKKAIALLLIMICNYSYFYGMLKKVPVTITYSKHVNSEEYNAMLAIHKKFTKLIEETKEIHLSSYTLQNEQSELLDRINNINANLEKEDKESAKQALAEARKKHINNSKILDSKSTELSQAEEKKILLEKESTNQKDIFIQRTGNNKHDAYVRQYGGVDFTLTMQASDPKNYPIFKKVVSTGWIFRTKHVVKQDSKYPTLSVLFIKDDNDSFTFDSTLIKNYRDTIEALDTPDKAKLNASLTTLHQQLKDALLIDPKNVTILPHEPTSYDLYGISSTKDNRYYFQQAYIAIQSFCNNLGISTPSIYSYTNYFSRYISPKKVFGGLATITALGGYAWYKSKQ